LQNKNEMIAEKRISNRIEMKKKRITGKMEKPNFKTIQKENRILKEPPKVSLIRSELSIQILEF